MATLAMGERPYRLLLVVGLLGALLPAAAATFRPQQPGGPCDTAKLANHLLSFCAPYTPRDGQCCEKVVTSVDIGGGAAWLRRIAADPQLLMAGLNATELYKSCGGRLTGSAGLTDATKAAGTSAGRPKSFKKNKVEKEVYERREESTEEEDKEEVEKIEKHKGTAGLIEIDNPNLAKPKSIKAKDVDVDRTAGLSRREREELEKQRSILHYKKLQEEGKTDQARKDLDRLTQIRQERAEAAKKREEEKTAAGTSAGRPKSFKKNKVEKEVYERREESIEEEDEEEVEKIEKHKGTAGLIEIDNPNLAKPKSIKAKDVDVDRTAGVSRREREELEKQRSILHYKKLQEEGKTDQARKDLDRLTQIRQERAEAAKKREEEKAAAGTSAGRPKSFKKNKVEKEVYERREESIEEEDEEEVEKIEKHKGTAGLIEIYNPNLAKPKSIKAKDVDVDGTAGLSRREREELEKQRSILHYKKLQEEGKTDQARKDLDRLTQIRQERAEAAKKREEEKAAAGTSAGRPKSFKKNKVEKEVYERREESIEEEDEEEVEKIEKHKGTAGLIEIDNPNLAKPKSIKAKDVDVDGTAGLSRREREELEKQRSILHYKKLQEKGKTDQARKDLDRLAQIRQKRAEAAKKHDVEKAGCNSSELALSIVKECTYNFTSAVTGCCSFILPTVDIENCLCTVAEEPDILGVGLTSRSLFRLYVRCGGKRHANENLAQNCDDTSGGTIPFSPPPPDVGVRDEPKEPVRSNSLNGVEVATDVGTWILVFFVFCAVVGWAICSWRTGLCLRAAPTQAERTTHPSSSITTGTSTGNERTTDSSVAPSASNINPNTTSALATDVLNSAQANEPTHQELAITATGPVDDTEIDQELESTGGDADRDRAVHTPCRSNLQKSLSTSLDILAEKADLSMKTLADSLPADDANVFGPRAPGSSSCKPIAPSPSTAACCSPWALLPKQKIGLASAGQDQNKLYTN